MRLKYKRMILLITTFTMLIGMVIFSIISPKGSHTKENKEVKEDTNAEEGTTEEEIALNDTQDSSDTGELVLEKSSDEALNQLVIDYFNASLSCDMDKLANLVSDVTILDRDELKVKYELVEAIHNIECYVVNGPSEGKCLVYVYSEIKFKDIETMAPGLSRLTVVKSDAGNYVIFFGADGEIEQFAEQADMSAPVQELVQRVSMKMEEALGKDADLKSLNERMTGAGQAEQTE